MLQRAVHGVVVLVMLGALAGCITPPTSPPARVDSVEVSPQPAGPGDTVTIRIEASHSVEVFNGVPLALTTPQGSGIGPDGCSSTLVHPGDDLTKATITIACVLPALVSNGTWTLTYRLNYVPPTDYPFQAPPPPPSTATFEVVGGSDDVTPPTLVSYSISPEVVTKGTPFTVTARVRDDSPIVFGVADRPESRSIVFYGGRFTTTCRDGSLTPVSATEAEVVFNCEGGWIGPVGPLTGQASGDLVVRDVLHNEARLPLTIDFESGA